MARERGKWARIETDLKSQRIFQLMLTETEKPSKKMYLVL